MGTEPLGLNLKTLTCTCIISLLIIIIVKYWLKIYFIHAHNVWCHSPNLSRLKSPLKKNGENTLAKLTSLWGSSSEPLFLALYTCLYLEHLRIAKNTFYRCNIPETQQTLQLTCRFSMYRSEIYDRCDRSWTKKPEITGSHFYIIQFILSEA